MPKLLFAALFVFGLAHAEVRVPALNEPVTDLTATLSGPEKAVLERKLIAFEKKKGSQIGVLIVPSTKPEEIEQYGIRVAEAWKLGRRNVDDGAILIVAREDRTLRIEVGYGLEGVLNDATAKRIISEIIIPRFKTGDFYGGIDAGMESMMSVIEGEKLPEPRAEKRSDWGAFIPIFFMAALFLGGILRAIAGQLPGALITGGILGLFAWVMAGTLIVSIFVGFLAFLFTLMGIRGFYGGGFGGFGGGGGFSGGGGGFGGGGASGRW